MSDSVLLQRRTKYCQAIEQSFKNLGHATNAQLLHELRKSFPSLSPTTVHRATARLASRGNIAIAPSSSDGSMRYEANTKPHDHFGCSSCESLYDIDIKDKIIPILESSIKDCLVSGRLIIKGSCKKCLKNSKGENI